MSLWLYLGTEVKSCDPNMFSMEENRWVVNNVELQISSPGRQHKGSDDDGKKLGHPFFVAVLLL